MAELLEREQACPSFDTLYMLAKKLEAGQPAHTRQYREKHRCYPGPMGRVATLEKERVAPTDSVSREESETEVEVVDGLNAHRAQVTTCYLREEQKCLCVGHLVILLGTACIMMLLSGGIKSR